MARAWTACLPDDLINTVVTKADVVYNFLRIQCMRDPAYAWSCIPWSVRPELSIPAAGQNDRGLWGRNVAGPDFLSMRRVFVSYSQPIRFARFEGKSVNRGLPVSVQARALDPCRRSEGSWALGSRMKCPVGKMKVTVMRFEFISGLL